MGTVWRLAEQKGIDIQVAALEEMLPNEMQFVLLGSGNPYRMKAHSARHVDQVLMVVRRRPETQGP